ncbi:peptidase domain-containing ABC transporter [Spirosoma terrae]|uniref:Peptidase domain-containing ABC transporter n=1 Tax=Spirosoma terrae TaxID=1968276 RepID=A0A6L9L680_9BACT|nr:peptidase domain-containing ABC transporter [Spirosoma terrae]NDU95910.1 peptidase domain-containing ABC transporter [Spirosoma terrae]
MVKFIPQQDKMDCGPACLAMVSSYYGKHFTVNYLKKKSYITKEGVSLLGICEAAEEIGFETIPVNLKTENLRYFSTNKSHENLQLPAILFWEQNHFVVLNKVKNSFLFGETLFEIVDPAHGYITLTETEFNKSWLGDGNLGIALFLNPLKDFFAHEPVQEPKFGFTEFAEFVKPYKKDIFPIFLGLLVNTILNLCFPFLTQTLIDKGVNAKSLSIVYVILIAQICIFMGSVTVEIIRSWITLYVSARLNLSIIYSFLSKIILLPLSFFDSKFVGDFNQRIQDHKRVEQFLTSQSISVFFSLLTFVVYAFILFYYDIKIVICYLLFTCLGIGWSLFFQNSRKHLDYSRFKINTDNQDAIYELLNSIQEIKLNNIDKRKLSEWENIQIRLFNLNLKSLRINQMQSIGFDAINQFKNLIVTYIAAREVIADNITLGAMLSISFIIGQLNAPLNQFLFFLRSMQDANLSIKRLLEVQQEVNEETSDQLTSIESTSFDRAGINILNLGFQYEGPKSMMVLDDLSMYIPKGKITAIVGSSGGGKTTLLKILLQFYKPVQGNIYIDNTNLQDISPKYWRSMCGVVMQDGYIFSDTIERNIAMTNDDIDVVRLHRAIDTANIKEFIDGLPLKLKTRIGPSAVGISAGQKQRILIARAVYHNPEYVFFDEATSALDAYNEKVIHTNLQKFFKGRTVLIIAHRLSTVKDADQIIVINNGRVVESGSHMQLVSLKKSYYHLVKNQLELAS